MTETRSTAYVYDSRGQVIREIAEPQDGSLCLVNVYGYDGHGNRTSTLPRNCDGVTAIPGVGTEAARPTGSAVFTTGAVQVRYDYPGLNSATERKVTTTNALGHQGIGGAGHGLRHAAEPHRRQRPGHELALRRIRPQDAAAGAARQRYALGVRVLQGTTRVNRTPAPRARRRMQ